MQMAAKSCEHAVAAADDLLAAHTTRAAIMLSTAGLWHASLLSFKPAIDVYPAVQSTKQSAEQVA